MSLSKSILGKDLIELTYQDIENFFLEEKEETEALEFKSGLGDFEKTLTNNIIKTIAAFLNSSGGILIWGAPKEKEKEKGKAKVCMGDLTPLDESVDKDRLINRISSSISYMPTGVRVVKLEEHGKYIYIFEVKESATKPHQYNGIYYIRLDGQSKPAPHYLVDALFKQKQYSNTEGFVNPINFVINDSYIVIDIEIILICHSPYNHSINTNYNLIANPGYFNNSEEGLYLDREIDLYYGLPYRKALKLVIPIEDIRKTCYQLTMALAIAGEDIESKNCFYKFDLSKQNSNKFDFKKCLIEGHENLTFLEDDITKNRMNHNEKIQNLLKREII